MLAEWYFCCCISANPSDTEAFLSILESLENPESDSQLLYLAYNELKRTEDRMQIYALPAVLKSLRRENLPVGLKSTIKRYFNHLTKSVPEGVENSIRQLINLALSNQPSAKIINIVNSFVRESQHLVERRLSPTPYLDLKEFLPETFVLAILADQLENHERLIDELIADVNKQDETSSPVSEFLQAALEYHFGRMAFRLATLIVSLTSIEYPDKLRSIIAKKASVAAQAEPDLLQTYAIVLFKESNIKHTAISQCRRIIQESLTLSELRNLMLEAPDQERHNLDALFRRVGIQNTPNRTDSLPILYWQIALWELTVQIDVSVTADELVQFWQPPTNLPQYLNVNCSEKDITKQVKEQLTSLINVRALKKEIQLQVNKGNRFHLNNKYAWLFLSPWIERTPHNPYPSADEPVLLIRLMGSVFVAIRLLQKLAKENFDRVEFAARLLAHASDVTATVERSYNKGKAPQLTPALMGLFRFAQRQIRLVGTGQFESIDPQNFVEICEKRKAFQEETSNNKNEESRFLDFVFPQVLISWILDAYPSAIQFRLSGRWLALIINVHEYWLEKFNDLPEKQKIILAPKNQESALLVRFICPGYIFNREQSLNWKTNRDNNKNRWEVNHRKLLLTERLYPNDWIGSEWDDDNVDWGSDPSTKASNRLVYTLELLDAIGHHLPDYEIAPEALEQKFSDWKQCLSSVGQAKNLDRFTRLRLLEFLDSSILENRPEEQILLASVLLEYGSIYDLKNMLERVYSTQADDRTFKETGDARYTLQKALLPIICNRLEKQTQLLWEINDERDTLTQQIKAQSPRETYKDLQYIELFKEWVTKILYLSNIHENAEDFRELGVNLANLRRASLERQATTTIRARTFNVELRNDQKLIILPSGEQPIADLAIKAINYNPNRLAATVFYEDFEIEEEIENIFKKSPADIRILNHESNSPLNVLAVVIDVNEIEQDDPYRWKYIFDCGFEFLLTYSSDQSLSFKPGDRVKLPIRQFKEGNKLWWRVSYKHSIKRLTHRSLPGDINKISVYDTWKNGERTLSFQRRLDQQTEEITYKENLRLWDADISRSFCQRSQTLKRDDLFAKLNAQQKWVPLDLDFNDLLFQAFHSQQWSNITLLTLIEETIGQFGNKAWRFSRQPGENYLIEQHYFLGDDATILADTIVNYQNRTGGAMGLLISVKLDFETGQVGLKLATTDDIKLAKLDEFYPGLVTFDDRNIRWRELFDRSDERLFAERDNNKNWFFHLPEKMVIPGYPCQIIVEWPNRRPDQNQHIADLLIIKWEESEWRKAVVIGETTPFHKITPRNQDWAAFLDRWLNLPEKCYIEAGERVKLSLLLGWIDREGDGFVPCLTNENLRVWVQAESITMLPLKHQDKPSIKSREAEIIWIEWFRIPTSPDIKNITIPPEAIQNHQCIGIITQVPKSGTKGTQCQVIWQVSQGVFEEQGLQIDNLGELRISLGDKIVGRQHHEKWTFHIEKPNIRVRALWSVKPWDSGELDQQLYYLGTVLDSDGNNLEIAESKSTPGKLVCLFHQHQLKENSHPAAKELRFKADSLWEGKPTSNTARQRYAFDEPPFQYKRAVLKFDEQLLIGNCREGTSDGKFTIQSIELIQTQRDDSKYVLRRRFNLRPIRNREKQDIHKDTELWKRRLNDYLKKQQPLRATFDKNRGELGFWLPEGGDYEIRVPEDSSGENWTLWVSLAPERGKFVMGGDYSDQARICLFMEQRRVWASCRLVPPLTLEEFRVNYCEAPTLNTDVFLLKDKDIHFYYVGPEEINDFRGEQYAEIHHRFEMGYGETLLIPESQLEFDGDSFSKLEFFIFYGDLIKVISFKKRLVEDSVTGQSSQYILNIKNILQWSEARQLYYQSSRYQIVHLLHLNPQSKDLEISYIDGFNENALTPQRKFEPRRFKAYLTSESKARLSNRLQRWADNAESDPVIFGRLDVARFRNSYGKDIYFDHVRLSFVESSKGSCLLNRDLVFLSAGQIKSVRNDMGLTLKPPKGFDVEDVGKDVKSLLLLRRNFSVRENLLKQVYEEKGQNYFQDARLLIQLTQNNEGRIFSRLLMEDDDVPSRQASALIGSVSNLGRAGLLATIVSAENRGVVQIEYKPGIFIRLQAYQVQSRSDDLPRGTIVRIEVSNGKLSITRAAFGNAQYVLEGIRPAVVLPTNDIQGIDPENWASLGRFSIGSLPDIISRPGRYTNKVWEMALPSEVIMIMSRQHPKIVCLGKDAKGNYRIAPPSDSFHYGCLIMIDNSLTIQYVPLNSELTDSKNPSIPWHLLSFGDESVKQILDRAYAESWRYHDNETFTWVTDTKKFKVENLQNRDHTIWNSPMFFQLFDEELRLRYTRSEFRRFGFPVEELIYALKQKGRSHCYPIAGISKFVAGRSQSLEYSLWIELAPGRLIELPVQLIVWRSGVNNNAKSLADLMHWQGFAPGDRVELELVSTDPLTIDRIALKNWIPGARNALGSNRCFLPVEALDERQGEITLGRGEFKLQLPFAGQNPNWHMVILTPENDIKGITVGQPKLNPKCDDVVFLEINAQDQIAILGFETMTPVPHWGEEDSWKNHPITGCLIRQKLQIQKYYLDSELLKNWIRAVGGALPVTVEGLHRNDNQHQLLFSMKHQQDAALIPLGCISLARFVDILPDQKTAILRCGGGLIPLPMREIISGLDRSLYTTAAEQLKQAQVSLWLRRVQNEEFKVGFSDDPRNQDILVESLDILLQKDGEEEVGLICQSIETKTLHWFPIQEAAWTTLSVEEFRNVFKSKGTFKVRSKLITRENQIVKTSILSMLTVPDVVNESKKLTVGEELFIQVVKQVETNDKNKHRYLVESLTTQVILDCEIYDRQRLQPGETLPVEVLRHIKGSPELITVVPVGKKRKYLDLPTWMTKTLPEPGLRRLSIARYMRWRRMSPLGKEKCKELIESITIDKSSEPLDRLLCDVFNDAYGVIYGQTSQNSAPVGQLEIAKLWYTQNRYKPEINAAFAIMAILLLNKHEDTKREAYKLTQNLGRRALRSLHIEVLYQRWLSIKDNRQRTDGLWQRLRQLETDQHLSIPLKETSPDAIRQFCNAIEMRADTNLLPIAKGLSAALGELSSTVELCNHALITKKLTDICLTLHPISKVDKLQIYHTNKLQEILKLIDQNGFDIMLLEPLNYKEDKSYTETVKIDLIAELFPQKYPDYDLKNWVIQQIDHLDALIDKSSSLEEKTENLKNRFHRIYKILEQ